MTKHRRCALPLPWRKGACPVPATPARFGGPSGVGVGNGSVVRVAAATDPVGRRRAREKGQRTGSAGILAWQNAWLGGAGSGFTR
jgi:hypothetical protein